MQIYVYIYILFHIILLTVIFIGRNVEIKKLNMNISNYVKKKKFNK